jgi:hypothetical protein
MNQQITRMEQTIAGLNDNLKQALKTNGEFIILQNAKSPAWARATTPCWWHCPIHQRRRHFAKQPGRRLRRHQKAKRRGGATGGPTATSSSKIHQHRQQYNDIISQYNDLAGKYTNVVDRLNKLPPVGRDSSRR